MKEKKRKEKGAARGWAGRSDLDQGITEDFSEEAAFYEQASAVGERERKEGLREAGWPMVTQGRVL